MTTHDEFAAAAAAYAIDALDRDEARLFEAHVSTCADCQRAVADYRRVAAGLGLSVDRVEAPPDLKARVLSKIEDTGDWSIEIEDEPKGRRRLPWWLLTAAAMAFLATGLYAWSLRVQLNAVRETATLASTQARDLRDEIANLRLESSRLTRAFAVMSSPDVVRVDLAGQATATAATGRAYVSRSRGLVFNADRLPPLAPGHVYQLWVLAPKPVSVGVLALNADGTTSLAAPLAPGVAKIDAVAVTAEPGPNGSAGPTMPILLVGTSENKGR